MTRPPDHNTPSLQADRAKAEKGWAKAAKFLLPTLGEPTAFNSLYCEESQELCLGKSLHLLFLLTSGHKKLSKEPSETWVNRFGELAQVASESLWYMVCDDILWSLSRQPHSPNQLPLSSVFLLHAGSTAAKSREPPANPGGGHICRWTSGGRSLSELYVFEARRAIHFTPCWDQVTLKSSFSPWRSSFPPMLLFLTSITWKWLWIQTDCLTPNSVLVICKARLWTPVCLVSCNRLIGHNDFIIWVLKWDNRQFFQSASRLITYVKGEEVCNIYMPRNCFFKLHSFLFILFESVGSSI